MSNGPKKKDTGANISTPKFVTLDAEEFNAVCQRVHNLLTKRAETAWDKCQEKPSQRSVNNHIEASKDAFAFIHLLELVEHMTEEIHELRSVLGALDEESEVMSVVGPPAKKTYLN